MVNTIDSPGSDPEPPSFTVTAELIEFLKILIGSRVSLTEVEQINKGILDLVSGLVIGQSFASETGELERVTIKTQSGESFTFTNKVNDSNIIRNLDLFDFLGNADLINPIRTIGVNNLDRFREPFKNAAQFKQQVTCLYNRAINEITLLQISSKEISEPKLRKVVVPEVSEQETSQHIPLPIEVRFLGQFSADQRSAFEMAAARWGSVIQGNLPPVRINGEIINGVVINAFISEIDGVNKVLGQSGPVHMRPEVNLPATGMMEFDAADLYHMEDNGSLMTVVFHEMGHVLGLGTLWNHLALLQGAGTAKPVFIGENAMHKFAKLLGASEPIPIPVEHSGGIGTRDSHWDESIFGNEVMTGFLGGGVNPLSCLTIAALQDMGYQVNYDAADFFVLPTANHLAMMVAGNVDAAGHNRCSRCNCGMCTTKLVMLPENALI
jgi:hypothetical protein